MPLSKERKAEYNKKYYRGRKLSILKPIQIPKPDIPLYNPAKHRPGDRVRIIRAGTVIETTIPELDADGHPMPEYN